MIGNLAQIVANARIQRLSLIGLAKNVGKTTATNHLVQTLLDNQHYRADELALTSLGLDGEAIDAMTGLPKPRYVPQAGLLIATTADLLRQAESEGAQFERLQQLPGRTALGPIILARVLRPGKVVIAGPTLLRDLRAALDQCRALGTRLGIIDGAINRLGAAAPSITDACILCTGASVASTPELVARRTIDVLKRLTTPTSSQRDAYMNEQPRSRLRYFTPASSESKINVYSGSSEPEDEAGWIVGELDRHEEAIYVLHGALTEELTRALLNQLPQHAAEQRQAELVIEDATKIFCHSVTLQKLATRELHVRVANPLRILAITMNPYTPDYQCTPQRLLDALIRELPENSPPVIDVVSGLFHPQASVTS